MSIGKDTVKFYLDWEEREEKLAGIENKIKEYIDEHGKYENEELIIGMWEGAYEKDPKNLVDFLVKNAEKFPNLKKIYWGDISWEECEVSWIQNTDLAPLVNNFKLTSLTVKGGNGLRLKNMKSDTLKKLEIISGGTSKDALNDIINSEIPNLEHLEIYMGVDDYGFDAKIEDMKPFVEKEKFPELKYLGLKNSDLEDEICELVLSGNILPQLEVLDLSYGTLSDKGVELLINNIDKISHLKGLDLEYNYASKELLDKLKEQTDKFGIKLDISQSEVDMDEENDWRYPYITE